MSRLSRRRACLELMAPELENCGSRLDWVDAWSKASRRRLDTDTGQDARTTQRPDAPADERVARMSALAFRRTH